ncbi:MAG: DUF1127 domain-containing protein [Pseudomonadota bacterium]
MFAEPVNNAAAIGTKSLQPASRVSLSNFFPRAVSKLASDAFWAVWRWYQVHHSTKVLSGLEDRILKDIGVPRSIIEGATVRRVAEEEMIRRYTHV